MLFSALRSRAIESDLDRRIAAAEAAVAEVKAKAAANLEKAQADLDAAMARLESAPDRLKPLYQSEVKARRYLCEQFANLAA